jgi:hypothetical protein
MEHHGKPSKEMQLDFTEAGFDVCEWQNGSFTHRHRQT